MTGPEGPMWRRPVPAAPAEGEAAAPRPLWPAGGEGDERERCVLCVEDNDDNRRLVGKLLASRGIRVLEAVDGLSGLEALERARPRVLLLDISLPDMSGLEVVAVIRRHRDPSVRGIPIIALTASAMPGDRERFLNHGCDDYLSKPLQALELIAMVERYLD